MAGSRPPSGNTFLTVWALTYDVYCAVQRRRHRYDRPSPHPEPRPLPPPPAPVQDEFAWMEFREPVLGPILRVTQADLSGEPPVPTPAPSPSEEPPIPTSSSLRFSLHRLCSSAVQQRPMDQLPDREYVWLRSRVLGTYLHADEDGHGVSLSRRRASMNAAWAVHRYYRDDQHVLLHSAAYGRYLAATDVPASLGCRGFRVEQRNYDELQQNAVRWQPFTTESGDDIMLRHDTDDRYGNHWNNGGVSVGDFNNITAMMEWVVDPIPTREFMPPLPRPTRLHLHVLLPSRVMLFIGDDEACYPNSFTFTFRGRSVFRRLAISRAGTYGRFTPLVVDLPRSRRTLVITAQTPDDGGR